MAGKPATASETLRILRHAFREAGLQTADLDARLLLEHLGHLSPLDLIRAPDRVLTQDVTDKLANARKRRLAGEPVHRILGFREFHGLHLTLSPDTLEPRPDTEVLVDAVLPFVQARCREEGKCRILDLGTGTGAIALALLAGEPRARALATDIAEGALDTARRNAQINGMADRFEAMRSDWFETIEGRFDLIVSNPPYIATNEIATLEPDVTGFDPLRALDGGPDGIRPYCVIAASARPYLLEGGQVAVEIGWEQREAVTALFESRGFTRIAAQRDLGGRDRVLVFS